MATYIAMALILAVTGIGLYFLFKNIGLDCQFCPNLKVTPFKNLPSAVQRKLLLYFEEYEKRVPDKSGVFVCCDCNTVFDDFSGEKMSRESDGGQLGCRTFCKVCGNIVAHCELNNPHIECAKCGTRYSWEVHEASGFRFLMPPKDAKVLKECSNFFWDV